jgi:hypothetical protein
VNKLATVLLCIVVGMGSLAVGYGIGASREPAADPIVQALGNLNLRENDTVEIEIVEGATGLEDNYSGPVIHPKKDDRVYNRWLSWFGLSAVEGAAKHQGIAADGSIGRNEGYGVLEQLWVTLRGWLWTAAILVIVVLVLAFIPATAPFARPILNFLASIPPFLGSLIMRAKAKSAEQQAASNKTQFVEVVRGGEEFKGKLYARTDITAEQKDSIWGDFVAAQQAKQDKATQAAVNSVTKG